MNAIQINQNLKIMKKFVIIIAVLICGIAMHAQTRYLNYQYGIKYYNIGKPDTTFNQQQFDEIQKSLKNANSQKIGGTLLSLLGVGLIAGGAYHAGQHLNFNSKDNSANSGTAVLLILGGASVGVGIPLAIIGANKSHKYKKQLNSMKSDDNQKRF